MSRAKLKDVLEKTLSELDRFSQNNDILRRGLSGVQTHSLDFHPNKILQGTKESLSHEGITPFPAEWAQIERAAHDFANNLKAKWKTPGYEYTVEAEGGKNIYRNITESAVYAKEKKEYNLRVSQIVNAEKPLKLVDAGHSLGYGVAETALLFALGTDLRSTVDLVRTVKERTEIHALMEKIPYGMLSQTGEVFTIKLEIESKSANRSTSAKLNSFGIPEDKFIGLVTKQIKQILSKNDWGQLQGSPNMIQEARMLIEDAAAGRKTKTKRPKSSASATKTKTSSKKVYRDRTPVGLKRAQKSPREWLSLLQIINSRLEETVKANMGEPALVNRTGRFAASVRATRITPTPQGFPSIEYTYDKTPYGVFDRRLGALPWATPARDPGLLIEKSIRQIASSLAIGRFYLRRE